MSSSDSLEGKKPVSAPEVVQMMAKITEDKLTGPNYSDWSKKNPPLLEEYPYGQSSF